MLSLLDVYPERCRASMSGEGVREEENPAVVRAFGVLQAIVLELKALERFGLEDYQGLETACLC